MSKQQTPGLPRHLRIAALQCNFEGGREATLRVPELWQDFGFDTEQLLHTHAELYNAVYNPDLHRPLVEEYLAECRKRGIGVLLYINCHILLPSEEGRKTEWAQVNRKGEFHRPYGTYYGCCLNSGWADAFVASLRKLAGLGIAGVFFDGPARQQCFCAACDAQFQLAGGTGPLRTSDEKTAADFTRASVLRFMQRAYAAVKSVNPDWLAYYNEHLVGARASAAEKAAALECNDIIGTEGGFQFYGPPKWTDIWRCGLAARLLDAVAGDKRKVIFMAGDHKPWSWYLHTPAETRLCYASTLANGASVWYGIHGDTSMLDGESGRAARDMVRFDKRHARLYEDTVSLADTAVLHSFDTFANYTAGGEVSDLYENNAFQAKAGVGNCQEALQGAFGALFRSAVPCDAVTDINLDNLGVYSVLVAPNAACLGPAAVAAIRAFVANGGTLIADAETSLYDAEFRRQPDFLLAELFGCSFRGFRRYQTHDYFEFAPEHDLLAGSGVRRVPAPRVAVDVVPAAGTEVLARLCPPLPGKYSGKPGAPEYPFILRNSFGKGVVYYLAGTFFEMYREFGIAHYRQILAALLAAHGRPVVECPGAPESLEITVRQSRPAGALLVHLVNYTGGMTRPIGSVVPLHGLTLKINQPFTSARALVAGKRLRPRQNGLLPLPPLHEFEVLVCE